MPVSTGAISGTFHILFWKIAVLLSISFRKAEGPTKRLCMEQGQGETAGWHGGGVGRPGRILLSKDQMTYRVVTSSFADKILRKN